MFSDGIAAENIAGANAFAKGADGFANMFIVLVTKNINEEEIFPG